MKWLRSLHRLRPRAAGSKDSIAGSIGRFVLIGAVNGTRRTATLPSILTVNGANTYQAAALQGLGLIQVPRYSVEQNLMDGTLVECLPETPPSSTPVYVLYPRNRRVSLRVRVFIDWVAKEHARHLGPGAIARRQARPCDGFGSVMCLSVPLRIDASLSQ